MTARRNGNVTQVASWLELTMVVREEQQTAPVQYGDGEDDGDILAESAAATTVEIVTKAKMQRAWIRYFYARRDAQPGSEVHFTNGHIMIVQEPLADVKAVLPGFVEVHASGAPSEIMVNPATVRFLHGHVAPLSGGAATPGTRLTFPNGNKLEVSEAYEALAGQFGCN